MAELLGLGCSHGPIILTPPEVWATGRERVFARVPNYETPARLLEELGDDNGLSRDISDQKKVVESFRIMRDRLHEWEPDVLMVIGDDQAENFLQDNLPPFCLYTGAEVDGFPFQRPGGADQLVGRRLRRPGSPSSVPGNFSREMRNYLIRDGFDMASSSALKGWDWGLAHAIINPLVFLDPDGKFPAAPPVRQLLRRRGGAGLPAPTHPQAVLPVGPGHSSVPGHPRRTGCGRGLFQLVPQFPGPQVPVPGR